MADVLKAPFPYFGDDVTLYCGDCLDVLPTLEDGSVHCVVTSPPYWGLRDYGTARWEGGDAGCDHAVRRWDGPKQTQGAMSGHAAKDDHLNRKVCLCGARRIDSQLGLEPTPDEYVANMVEVFRRVWRVLRDDGTVFLVLGDSYCSTAPGTRNAPQFKGSRDYAGQWANYRAKTPPGLKPKDLIGIPWRVAFALQADGWVLRSDIIWSKPNPMPESVRDRPTKAHEYVFLLAKKAKYYYDAEAIKDPATCAGQMRGGSTNRYEQNAAGMDYREYATRNKRDVWTIQPQAFKGVAVYGSYRIASPDCLEHDYQADLALVQQCGGRLLSSSSGYSPDTSSHPSQGQKGAVVAIPLCPCELPFGGFAAISRNIGTHKREDGSGQDEIFFGISDGHTGYMALLGRSVAMYGRRSESSTEVDAGPNARGSYPSAQRAFHIVCMLTFGVSPKRCTCHYMGKVEKRQDHFAVFPEKLVEPCILAGCPEGGVVLDPFLGSGTTAIVALKHGRKCVGIELSQEYNAIAEKRIRQAIAGQGLFRQGL